MKSMVWLVGLVLVGGCVRAQLTPEAQAVRITTNPEAVRGCDLKGEVAGKSSTWSRGGILFGTKASEEDARRRVRLRAVELGGNVVLIETAQTSGGGSQQRGEAYLCPTPGDTTASRP